MPAGSARADSYNPILDKLEIMNKALGKIADKYGVGIAQVPVAWAIANKDKSISSLSQHRLDKSEGNCSFRFCGKTK